MRRSSSRWTTSERPTFVTPHRESSTITDPPNRFKGLDSSIQLSTVLSRDSQWAAKCGLPQRTARLQGIPSVVYTLMHLETCLKQVLYHNIELLPERHSNVRKPRCLDHVELARTLPCNYWKEAITDTTPASRWRGLVVLSELRLASTSRYHLQKTPGARST
jgi:hypothetical protein